MSQTGQIPWDEQDAISSIETTVAEFREKHKMIIEVPVEVLLPHWRHQQYLDHYGSQEALNEYFGAKIVCQWCRDVAQSAEYSLRMKGILR